MKNIVPEPSPTQEHVGIAQPQTPLWVIARHEGRVFIQPANGDRYDVAVISNTHMPCAEARAHLIVAAPELAGASVKALEAIDNILPAHRGQHEYAQLLEAFNALQAALARAAGRADGSASDRVTADAEPSAGRLDTPNPTSKGHHP